jgi:hypothetical protein
MSEALADGPEPTPYVPSLLDADVAPDVAPDDVAAWAATVTPGSAVVKPLVHVDVQRCPTRVGSMRWRLWSGSGPGSTPNSCGCWR